MLIINIKMIELYSIIRWAPRKPRQDHRHSNSPHAPSRSKRQLRHRRLHRLNGVNRPPSDSVDRPLAEHFEAMRCPAAAFGRLIDK